MTKGYGGRQIVKRISVQTNDTQHRNLQLVVKGKVKKFVTIRPKRVRLTGVAGDVVHQTVAVIPEKAYPFRIIAMVAKPGKNIKVAFEEKEGETGSGYQVFIENVRRQPGQYYENIVIKTDSKVRPEIDIRVYGNIAKPKNDTSSAPESSSTLKKSVEKTPAVSVTPAKKDSTGGVKINISKGTKAE